MNSKKLFLIIFFISCSQILPQNFQITGRAAPGNILIGKINQKDLNQISSIYLDSTRLKFDHSGYFVFGFDRNDSGAHFIRITSKDKGETIKRLNLAERKFKEQKINNIKQKYVSPPKKELARIKREAATIKKAREKIGLTDSAYFSSGFIRPVKGGRISGVFGSQRILNGTPANIHNGLDIAAPKGTPVYAASDGIVVLTGRNFYYSGNLILIDHGQGLSSMYIHLNKIEVTEGQKVKKGQLIGEIGTTGRSTGPHLHWGVQWYDRRIDPMSLLEMSAVQ